MIIHNTIWKECPQFDGYYVNIYGDVLSLKQRTPLVMKQSLDSKNYRIVNIFGKVRRVHRLVASAFIGLDFNNAKQIVLHIDDNPSNNNLSNLSVGTQKDNMDDMHKKGRGRSNYKITPEQLIVVKKRLLNGERSKDLAIEYGVSTSLMSSIRTGNRRNG
jgi:hypothetical protein